MNAIHALNKLLSKLPAQQGAATGFKPVRLHLLRNDKLVEPLGFAGKLNASTEFLTWLFEQGQKTAHECWQKNITISPNVPAAAGRMRVLALSTT